METQRVRKLNYLLSWIEVIFFGKPLSDAAAVIWLHFAVVFSLCINCCFSEK